MSQTFTVPVVAYFNVEVDADDPEAAIRAAEAIVHNFLPIIPATLKPSGPPQCVEHDRVWDQYEEDVDE